MGDRILKIMIKANQFAFTSYEVDETAGIFTFRYTVELGAGDRRDFSESLILPDFDVDVWHAIPELLKQSVLQALHLALGVSYWKMHCAKRIRIEGYFLTPEQAEFWNVVYTKGLGEFFFRNQIDYRGLVNFPSSDMASPNAVELQRQDRCFVPIGGGKDSAVSLEMLRRGGYELKLISLGTSFVQKQMAQAAGMETLVIHRKLDQAMLDLTKRSEVYNGHVPISMIYSFVGVLAALVYDYRWIVFSNERSAEEGNVEYYGNVINHQWSKSEEFERMVQAYVKRYVTPSVTPFSLLRPLTEFEVVRRFAVEKKYFKDFSSCNRNFVVASDQPISERGAYWCCACPKCAFVFAMLSAWLSRSELISIFGQDLYSRQELLPLFKQLLGLEDFKPFECVGTPEEMKVAMRRAHLTGSYDGEVVMEYFTYQVEKTVPNFAKLERELLEAVDVDRLPKEFRKLYLEI